MNHDFFELLSEQKNSLSKGEKLEEMMRNEL